MAEGCSDVLRNDFRERLSLFRSSLSEMNLVNADTREA